MTLNQTHTDTEKVYNKDVSSNLNIADDYNVDVTAAAAAADIDKMKLPLGCKNSIRDLDDIQDEHYQVKQKGGLVYDRSDDVNHPPLPPESPVYTMNVLCIHSNIPNNGEILSLPVFSPAF